MVPRLRHGTYHGHCVGRLPIAGLLLNEYTYAPRFTIPLHSHEPSYLCTLIQGSFTETCGGRVRDCRPGGLVLHACGEVHADRFGDAGGRVFGIELGPSWRARLDPYRCSLETPFIFPTGLCADLVRKLYREFHSGPGASALVVEGLVLEILGEACRPRPADPTGSVPPWLRTARAILHERCREPLTLAQVAAAVDVHPVHLARAFRRNFGCTVGDYVRRLRIERACQALVRSDQPLVEIALESGFADQSQFCRTFKRQLGLTPSRFRRESHRR
jgi:AraC family transcriptional regulator